MIKVLALFFLSFSAMAYVPTVESLFRHGSNPDVSTNGVSITLSVKKVKGSEDGEAEEFYRIFFTKNTDNVKVAQTRYSNNSFSEASLQHKTYFPNFTAYSIKPELESAEKGLFYGLMVSLALNDGSILVSYLKSLGVPVKLNDEILNREKVELLADYKRYLVAISKDRNARNTEMNPMRPEDSSARERADQIMNGPMYIDTNHVKLSKDDGEIAWVVNAENFESVFSYKERDLQRMKFKSTLGEFSVVLKDYWLANGTHAMPRYILIKTFSGDQYQVEVTNLRHYVEKEDDFSKRLKNWDEILKGKESQELRPVFLL